VVERLQRLVEDRDVTVRHIRSVIFELQTARLPGHSAREAARALARFVEVGASTVHRTCSLFPR
jgi:hypothetical protein